MKMREIQAEIISGLLGNHAYTSISGKYQENVRTIPVQHQDNIRTISSLFGNHAHRQGQP